MRIFFWLPSVLFLMTFANAQSQPAPNPNIAFTESLKIDAGPIRGVFVGREKDVRAYKGVPFATPPVSDLRWKPPQPAKRWEAIRDCVEFGPACPQPEATLMRDTGRQSEDCLYLNVWTAAKTAHAESAAEKRPVMVWIHGGGHVIGSGAMPYYDGQHLARLGIVVVTINYRLGPFGYFAHPLLSKESEHHVSGNYGLLDQIAALQWVQKNIAAFGGDPNCVTIFGESAGAVSVCRLMVSPLAKGLFHRAIAESGGAHGRNRHLRETWYGLEPMETVGEKIAEKLGCDKATDPLAALRGKSAAELLAASRPAAGLFSKGTMFGPIIDGWALPDDPVLLFENGKTANVPLLIGSNADEGTIFLAQLPIKRPAGYQLMVRGLFADHADEILKLFPAETDAQVTPALNKLVTAMSFVAPARSLARTLEKHKTSVYLYHFTRVPKTAGLNRRGAFHGLEVAYVFGTLAAVGFNEDDRRLSKQMMQYWVNFARTGDPNGPGLPKWPRYQAKEDTHLDLGDEVRAETGLYQEACDLLEKIQTERIQTRTQTRRMGRWLEEE